MNYWKQVVHFWLRRPPEFVTLCPFVVLRSSHDLDRSQAAAHGARLLFLSRPDSCATLIINDQSGHSVWPAADVAANAHRGEISCSHGRHAMNTPAVTSGPPVSGRGRSATASVSKWFFDCRR